MDKMYDPVYYRKWLGILQQSDLQPLIMTLHEEGLCKFLHDEKVLLEISFAEFERMTANEILEKINRSNNDER